MKFIEREVDQISFLLNTIYKCLLCELRITRMTYKLRLIKYESSNIPIVMSLCLNCI